MKDTILSILGLLILFFPTALKVWRDRNGVKHPDPTFIQYIRLMMGAGFVVYVILHWGNPYQGFWKTLLLVSQYPIISGCLYASAFPYIINWVHLKNGVTSIRKIIVPPMNGPYMYFDSVYDFIAYAEATRKEVFLHIVSHLSKTAWPDKTKWWRGLGWKGRLVVNGLILIGGLILYFSR